MLPATRHMDDIVLRLLRIMTSHCLIIIDLLNDFLDTWDAERTATLIARTNRLAAAFRLAGLPVIWVRQEFKPDLSDAFAEMRERNIKATIMGTRGARLHAKLDWRPGDVVIVKKRYSAFFRTDLEDRLAHMEAGHVVLCGINTHACVRMTAIDAYQRDLRVTIARDCTASYDEEHARISLAYMDGKIAAVAPSDAIIKAIVAS